MSDVWGNKVNVPTGQVNKAEDTVSVTPEAGKKMGVKHGQAVHNPTLLVEVNGKLQVHKPSPQGSPPTTTTNPTTAPPRKTTPFDHVVKR
ncbi:MAG: hypothetical protein F4118_10085 [Acidimicrobiaceae bacterium]|nr:hypothetical protein [Candidatus Poribacteria bacterium]MYI36757.1 hypothetical protein [Acidimicrobiaceae bacterium]